MYFNNGVLSVANPTNTTIRSTYDFSKIFAAEARVDEIAFVNPHKAPELIALFSAALRDATSFFPDLHLKSAIAARKKRERRAVVLLEQVAVRLSEKKVSNNEASREAVVELDPEYGVLCDIESELEAAYVFVREKIRSLESYINSVKKILDAGSAVPQTSYTLGQDATVVNTSDGKSLRFINGRQ